MWIILHFKKSPFLFLDPLFYQQDDKCAKAFIYTSSRDCLAFCFGHLTNDISLLPSPLSPSPPCLLLLLLLMTCADGLSLGLLLPLVEEVALFYCLLSCTHLYLSQQPCLWYKVFYRNGVEALQSTEPSARRGTLRWPLKSLKGS